MTDEPQTAPLDVNEITSGPANVLSCRRFLGYSIALSVLFLAAHLAGLREHTAALSGTGLASGTTRFFGVAYILLYACFVGIVPILLIATVLVKALAALRRSPIPDSEAAAGGTVPRAAIVHSTTAPTPDDQ